MNKNVTNKGVIIFTVVFFVVFAACYAMLFQDVKTIESLSIAAVSSLVTLVIFYTKRKWDRQQQEAFKR